MSLLDILNSKDLGSVLGTILGGAGGQMPGGMQQGGSPYGQYGNAGRGGRDAGFGGAGGLGGLGGLDLGKLTQGGLGGGLGMLLGTLLGAGMGAGARSGAGGMARNVALVGAGLAAWSFFKKWSAQRQQQGAYAGGSGADPFAADFKASAGDPTAQLVVRSLVYAARADGHVDEAEQIRIVDAMKQLFPGQDLSQLANSLLREPVDARALAAQVKSMEEAEDVYMMSCMAIDIDHPAERAYLDELAGSFGMSRDRQAAIESEASEAKSRMAGAGL